MNEACSVHSERGRGTKSNGVGTRGKERDLEFRLTEQVYIFVAVPRSFF